MDFVANELSNFDTDECRAIYKLHTNKDVFSDESGSESDSDMWKYEQYRPPVLTWEELENNLVIITNENEQETRPTPFRAPRTRNREEDLVWGPRTMKREEDLVWVPRTKEREENLLETDESEKICDTEKIALNLKKLIQYKFCTVCKKIGGSRNFGHYQSAKHYKKVNKYVAFELEKLNLKEPFDPKLIFCQECNLVLSGNVRAKSHYNGESHWRNAMSFCQICLEVIMVSMEQHVLSDAHLQSFIKNDEMPVTNEVVPVQNNLPVIVETEAEPMLNVSDCELQEEISRTLAEEVALSLSFMMTEFYCGVCFKHCISWVIGHYSSRRHYQKVKATIKMNFRKATDEELRLIFCESCNKVLTGNEFSKEHYKSKEHIMNLNKYCFLCERRAKDVSGAHSTSKKHLILLAQEEQSLRTRPKRETQKKYMEDTVHLGAKPVMYSTKPDTFSNAPQIILDDENFPALGTKRSRKPQFVLDEQDFPALGTSGSQKDSNQVPPILLSDLEIDRLLTKLEHTKKMKSGTKQINKQVDEMKTMKKGKTTPATPKAKKNQAVENINNTEACVTKILQELKSHMTENFCFLCNKQQIDYHATSHYASDKHKAKIEMWLIQQLQNKNISINIQFLYCKTCNLILDGTELSRAHCITSEHVEKSCPSIAKYIAIEDSFDLIIGSTIVVVLKSMLTETCALCKTTGSNAHYESFEHAMMLHNCITSMLVNMPEIVEWIYCVPCNLLLTGDEMSITHYELDSHKIRAWLCCFQCQERHSYKNFFSCRRTQLPKKPEKGLPGDVQNIISSSTLFLPDLCRICMKGNDAEHYGSRLHKTNVISWIQARLNHLKSNLNRYLLYCHPCNEFLYGNTYARYHYLSEPHLKNMQFYCELCEEIVQNLQEHNFNVEKHYQDRLDSATTVFEALNFTYFFTMPVPRLDLEDNDNISEDLEEITIDEMKLRNIKTQVKCSSELYKKSTNDKHESQLGKKEIKEISPIQEIIQPAIENGLNQQHDNEETLNDIEEMKPNENVDIQENNTPAVSETTQNWIIQQSKKKRKKNLKAETKLKKEKLPTIHLKTHNPIQNGIEGRRVRAESDCSSSEVTLKETASDHTDEMGILDGARASTKVDTIKMQDQTTDSICPTTTELTRQINAEMSDIINYIYSTNSLPLEMSLKCLRDFNKTFKCASSTWNLITKISNAQNNAQVDAKNHEDHISQLSSELTTFQSVLFKIKSNLAVIVLKYFIDLLKNRNHEEKHLKSPTKLFAKIIGSNDYTPELTAVTLSFFECFSDKFEKCHPQLAIKCLQTYNKYLQNILMIENYCS